MLLIERKIIYVVFQKMLVWSNFFFQNNFIISTTASYEYYIGDTIEVNYLIKQHENLRFSNLYPVRVEE